MTSDSRARLREAVRSLYAIASQLEEWYPGKSFTPDGVLVGSIAEVYAAETYGITLYEDGAHATHDGFVGNRKVQIKCTQGNRVALGSRPKDCPDSLIVLHLSSDGEFKEVYNGNGSRVWGVIANRKPQKTGQTQLSLARLRELDTEVSPDERVRPVW